MPKVKAVTSRDNPLLVRLRKLAHDGTAYRRLGSVWMEGDHLASAFLKRGGVPLQSVITEPGWDDARLRDLAHQAEEVVVVPEALMAGLSSLESPSPLGLVVPWQAEAAIRVDAPSVVLDRLQDAGNVGAVLRSAAAFGFQQVIAMKGTTALWSAKVLRAGMGAHFGLHLVEAAQPSSLDVLKVPLLATSSHAAHALHEVPLPWPCAWVMGHEGQGVSEALAQQCVQSLRIPQPGGEESLNVAAAAAVCLYESARQRASR